MRITKQKLKQIILEELNKLKEMDVPFDDELSYDKLDVTKPRYTVSQSPEHRQARNFLTRQILDRMTEEQREAILAFFQDDDAVKEFIDQIRSNPLNVNPRM